jgi:hypothetical protein
LARSDLVLGEGEAEGSGGFGDPSEATSLELLFVGLLADVDVALAVAEHPVAPPDGRGLD